MAYAGGLVTEYLRQTHQRPHLTDREKQLVGLAVTLTRGCLVCTRGRIEKARASGLGDEVVNALVEIVAAVNAGVTAATAREGFRLVDESQPGACLNGCSPPVAGGAHPAESR